MNKFKQIFKPIWNKFITRRKENGDIYGEHIENVIKEVARDYVGKALLIIGFIMALVYQWSPSKNTGSFEGFQLTIPLILCFWILICSGIEFTLLCTFTFFRKKEHYVPKLIIWFDNQFVSPISNELNNNAFGFVLGNIILLATLYDHSWMGIVKNWQENPQNHSSIIAQTMLFLFASVVVPLIICWLNTLLSRFINVLKVTDYK